MSGSELCAVFNVFIDNKIVTELELQKAGFNSQKIEHLQEKNVISKLGSVFILKKTYYSELFLYGISLLRKNNIKKAKEVFNFCLKLKPDNNRPRYYIFIANIKQKDYNEALKYFENKPLIEWTNDDYFILYMLNLIIDLPQEYINLVTQYKKVYLREGKDLDNGKYAEFKRLILKFKFKEAEKYLKTVEHESETKPLFRELTFRASERIVNLNVIFNLLKNNDLKTAKRLIREYLIRKNKIEYYKLIKDLIKLSSRTDANYEILMDFLTSIETDEQVKIDVSNLTERFNDDVEKGNYSEANFIYVILREINDLGLSNVNLRDFSKRLAIKQ